MSASGNGRDSRGHFVAGHSSPGPGRPQGSKTIGPRLRSEFWKAVRASDVRAAVRVIRRIVKSKTADDRTKLAAAVHLLDRIVGTPTQADTIERIERLEELIGQRTNGESHELEQPN